MLPDGLESELATDGAPLSQGQIAQLMIARAILGQPRLLLLDRTLDVLDEETRARVADVLFDAAAPWTLALVTEHADLAVRCGDRIQLDADGNVRHDRSCDAKEPS